MELMILGVFCGEDLNDFDVLTSNTHFGLKLKPPLSLFQLASLIKSEKVLPYAIESKLPWHVLRNVSFIVDSDSLESRQVIGIDAWWF